MRVISTNIFKAFEKRLRYMRLGISSVGSSSSGNSYLISDGDTHLVLDAGVSCKKIVESIESYGIDKSEVSGIFITHEHLDHVKSVGTLAKKLENSLVITSRGTAYSSDKFERISEKRTMYMASQDEVMRGDIRVKAFSLSHDAAEPLGFSFSKDDTKITVVTDTGVVTDEIFEEIKTSDVIVMEANHEVNILQYGPYPYSLKRRIMSDKGHLSNVSAAESMTNAIEYRRSAGKPKLRILLAHLSTTNNTPYQAKLTVTNVLEENGIYKGRDFDIGVALKDVPSLMIQGYSI